MSSPTVCVWCYWFEKSSGRHAHVGSCVLLCAYLKKNTVRRCNNESWRRTRRAKRACKNGVAEALAQIRPVVSTRAPLPAGRPCRVVGQCDSDLPFRRARDRRTFRRQKPTTDPSTTQLASGSGFDTRRNYGAVLRDPVNRVTIIYCWLSSSSPTGRHPFGPPGLGGKRGANNYILSLLPY